MRIAQPSERSPADRPALHVDPARRLATPVAVARCRRAVAASASVIAVLLVQAAPAAAQFGAASLLSGTAELQFERADAPALAREGGYVAFEGSLAGVAGVWRRNLQTGVVEAVAAEYDAENPQRGAPTAALGAPEAAAPSISADGRYVAFTTTADLEPLHAGANGVEEGEPPADVGCPEVYVRDMDLPAGVPGAYTLASALGGGEGIAFAGPCAERGTSFGVAGAQAAPGVALSADGRSVAFTVLSPSNLVRGPGCPQSTPLAECPPETPPSQVAVHNLKTGVTTLVSATPEGQPTPGGGAFPSVEDEPHISGTAESPSIGEQITGSSAAISGDGETVAWMGTDVPAQVPSAAPEIAAAKGCGSRPGSEVEPLWRPIAEGPNATTRRLLAGAGLDLFYNRSEDGEVVCAGSFVDIASWRVFIPPVLSEDGRTVALLANAPRPAALQSIEIGTARPTTDVYVVHVEGSPATPPQVVPLTETPDYDATEAAVGFVNDVAISPDGERVAFESARSIFTLPTLTLISPPLPTAGYLAQTYEANLEFGTLQRVTVTYDGAEPAGSAGLVSLDGDGRLLAFASAARNLFYGDAANGPQVYASQELPAEQPPAPQSVGAIPVEQPPQPEWLLDATATAQPDGSVVVYAQAPGAGRLIVTANAQLPAPAARTVKIATRTHARAPGRSVPARSAPPLSRDVARGAAVCAQAGPVRLVLGVGAAYRSFVRSANGLYAILRLTFTAPGRPTLAKEIPVTFHSRVGGEATKRKPIRARRVVSRRHEQSGARRSSRTPHPDSQAAR